MLTGKIQIYVADLAAYNNGVLHGVWIDATQGAEDIRSNVEAILESSTEEDAAEWAIHDYDGFEGANIGESESFESIHDKAQFILHHGTLGGLLLSHFCGDLADTKRAIEEAYCGVHYSLTNYVQELTE